MKYCQSKKTGFSLVELIVVSAMVTLVFGALFSSFQYTFKLINASKSKLTATSIANDRMEHFRSLPYNEVGTVAGFPSGAIPQNSVITLNKINFNERVAVFYVDDDADNLGLADNNGIITDYKQIVLEYTWSINGATTTVKTVSNIVPRSIETDVGGGTIRINVLDSDSSLLTGASVRVTGSSSTAPYDVTNITDPTGAALFTVAADSGYQVEVTANISGNAYSVDKTYEATAGMPHPTVAPFSVLEADISTLTFQIGELSDLGIHTFSSIVEGVFDADFSDTTTIASSTDISTSTGRLRLADTLGVYENSGNAYIKTLAPTPIARWSAVLIDSTIPVNTDYIVQFYTGAGSGPYTLIPDSDLSGNSAGFVNTIIDISDLDIATYPSIVIGVTLETTDTASTPVINNVSIFYRATETPLANFNFNLVGSKVIGLDASLVPIYKYNNSLATDGSGVLNISDLEFDTYTASISSSYDIASACSEHPFVQQAGIDGKLELVIVGGAVNTLRVSVVDGADRPIPGATVSLSRSGYSSSIDTDSCGQAFFTGGVAAEADYVLDISRVGYITQNISSLGINDYTTSDVTLVE